LYLHLEGEEMKFPSCTNPKRMSMNFIGIIPARFASTRFPGKPLADIGGKIMIQRVYEQAAKVLEYVVVATDDKRIETAVEGFGGRVVLTSASHRSGTDRCAEAVKVFQERTGKKIDVVLNIQGDEPFIQPAQLEILTSVFADPQVQIATLIKEITANEDIFNPNLPKVVLNKWKNAIYFSRSPIPFIRNYDKEVWLGIHKFYKHVGIYAYRTDILNEITKLEQSSLELAESLEQNRWIENGYTIRAELTPYETVSVDVPSDIEKIRGLGLI
jgi:3-deoxy-manno-octulosonate cytidylyltransferase (CMP-KDO synthetase)